jgi:hypothetical protein
MRHKIRNLWNIRQGSGNPLSLFFLDSEPAANNSEIYHIQYLQNMRVKTEPPHQKQNNIPQCRRCQAYFHTKGYCAHRPRCVKCGKSHSTEQCTLPKRQPATCLHCGEWHPTSYRGCKVYQEIIHTRFYSPRKTASIHITNSSRQEKESPAAPQKTEGRPKMTYVQATRNSTETPTITANNTQEHTQIKTMQESFTGFETILSKQAEQMSTLMNLLTAVLNRLVK